MQKIALVVVAIALAGCSALGIDMGSSKKDVATEKTDKRTGAEITSASCGGFLEWSVCSEKASKACPKGFDVTGREESLIAQKRILYFRCK